MLFSSAECLNCIVAIFACIIILHFFLIGYNVYSSSCWRFLLSQNLNKDSSSSSLMWTQRWLASHLSIHLYATPIAREHSARTQHQIVLNMLRSTRSTGQRVSRDDKAAYCTRRLRFVNVYGRTKTLPNVRLFNHHCSLIFLMRATRFMQLVHRSFENVFHFQQLLELFACKAFTSLERPSVNCRLWKSANHFSMEKTIYWASLLSSG